MKLVYICLEAIRLCLRFRLRSFLMIGSTLIGVAGIIVSTNYAAAGRLKVVNQLRKMGTDVLIVTPRQSKNVAGRARTGSTLTTLRQTDDEAIHRTVTQIKESSEIAAGAFMLKAGDLSKPLCPVVGCQPQYVSIKDWRLLQGRFFDDRETRSAARVAVVGYTVAQDLFPNGTAVGQRLLINRVPMEVIGVLSERGQGLDSSNEDSQVYIPVSTAMTRLMNRTYLDAMIFRVSSSDYLLPVMKRVDTILKHRHRSRTGSPADYEIQNQQATLDTLNASSTRLAFLIRSIGISGLLVSGLGVFALSWIAIRDRTPELGTRRALGAASADVFFQILCEAMLVSVTGGGAALVTAYAITRIAESNAQLPAFFDRTQAALLLLSSVVLNQAFGLIAARRAARVNPITALGYE